MRPDPSFPVDLSDLAYGEHLLLWAFRTFARGRECVIVRREFDHGCGEHAVEAYNAMRLFVQQLAIRGRRSIVLAPPGCLTVVRDEHLMLCLFASAQVGDSERFAAYFRSLAAAPYDPVLERVARIVVSALGLLGHRLRLFIDLDQELQCWPGQTDSVMLVPRLVAS